MCSSDLLAQPTPPGMPPTAVVKPALAASAYGPRARRVLARISRQRGAPSTPEALYGYEAVRVVLDAIAATGGGADRTAVAQAALAPRARRSVLGPYRVVRGGDVSTVRFGAYRRDARSLTFLGPRTPNVEGR